MTKAEMLRHSPMPKFTQLGSECCTKEWVARVGERDYENLWAMIRIGSSDMRSHHEEDEDWDHQLTAEVFVTFSEIDWHKPVRGSCLGAHLMIDQTFLCQLPEWTASGTNSVQLLYDAMFFVAVSY